MSVDGFISTHDDDLSWLSIVQNGKEDYGYADFNNQVDTYIVGRKTYEVVLKLTGGDFTQAKQHKCYVITRQNLPNKDGVTFFNGDLEELIITLKKEKGKHIYCDGGGEIVKLLMGKKLIDEYIIYVIPTILGDGKRLFKGGINPLKLKAMPSKHFESGLVQLHYVKI